MGAFVEEKFREIIKEELELEEITLKTDDKLVNLGFNSATFIKLVVRLEEAFNIEFEDEDLNYDNFQTIADIIKYVEQKMKQNQA